MRRTFLIVHNHLVISQNPIPRQTMSRGGQMRGFSMENYTLSYFETKLYLHGKTGFLVYKQQIICV